MKKAFAAIAMAACACAVFALPKVAVLNPTLDTTISGDIASPIVDKVQEVLVKSKKYSILDRASRDVVWQERNFQLSSGEIDQKEIKNIGKGLGADLVVVIKVKKIGSLYSMSTTLIDVETLEVMAQSSAESKESIESLLTLASQCGSELADMEYETVADSGTTPVAKRSVQEINQITNEVRNLLEDKAFLKADGQKAIAAKVGAIASVDRYNLFENYKKDSSRAVIAMLLNSVPLLPIGSFFQGDIGGGFGLLGLELGSTVLFVYATVDFVGTESAGSALLMTGSILLFLGVYTFGYIQPYIYNDGYNTKLARALNVSARATPVDLGIRLASGGGTEHRIGLSLVSLGY
jgi:hypothetical protein